MTRTYTLLVALICFATTINAQKFVDGFGMSGAGDEGISKITLDNNGDIITTGYFTGTVDFDPGTGTTNATAVDDYDFFLQKCDNAGNLLWVKTFGSATSGVARNEYGSSIVTDASDNIYVIGGYTDTVDLDPGTGEYEVYGPNNIPFFFISKFDASGNFLWGRSILPPNFPYSYSSGSADITMDKNKDYIYLTYNYGESGFNRWIGIEKWDLAGNMIWQEYMFSSGSGSSMASPSIAMDGNDDIYVGGTFRGGARFDPGSTNVVVSGGESTFWVKFDSSGNFIYQKGVHGDRCYDIAVDNNNNLVLVGSFNAASDFDPGPGVVTVFPGGQFATSMYVLKITAAGNFDWVQSYGSGSDNVAFGTSVDASGNVYVTGILGDATFSNSPYVNFQQNSGPDAFILKLNPQGTYVFAQHFSGQQAQEGISIANNNATGEFYVGGRYEVDIDLESNTSGSTKFTAKGAGDMYIARFINCPTINTSVSKAMNTLTVAESGATYQWIDCNTNIPVSGANGRSFTPTVDGSYAVAVSTGLCSDTSSCTTVTGVGITDVDQLSGSIYPNPTTGAFNISLNKVYNVVELQITSVTGQVLSSSTYHNTGSIQTTLDVQPGLYYITLSTDERSTITRKVVVNR